MQQNSNLVLWGVYELQKHNLGQFGMPVAVTFEQKGVRRSG